MLKKYILIGLIIGQTAAFAKPYKKLTAFVAEEVTPISDALNTGGDSMILDGNYEFKRLYLRLQAKAGFSIEVVNLEVIPELELAFQKE